MPAAAALREDEVAYNAVDANQVLDKMESTGTLRSVAPNTLLVELDKPGESQLTDDVGNLKARLQDGKDVETWAPARLFHRSTRVRQRATSGRNSPLTGAWRRTDRRQPQCRRLVDGDRTDRKLVTHRSNFS